MPTNTPPAPDPHPREEGLSHCPDCREPLHFRRDFADRKEYFFVCGHHVTLRDSRTPPPAVVDGVSDTDHGDAVDGITLLKKEIDGLKIETVILNETMQHWCDAAMKRTVERDKLKAEVQHTRRVFIEAMGSEVIEGADLHQAACILVSQRDNARNEVEALQNRLSAMRTGGPGK